MSYYGKKGLCMCFNFQIAFRKECKGVIVFRARTSSLNKSYLFQSHYCNARFAYIRNQLYILGTGALDQHERNSATVIKSTAAPIWCAAHVSKGKLSDDLTCTCTCSW